MNFDNITQLTAALAAGRSVFCGERQTAYFLQSDGSVVTLNGAMVAPPSAARATLWSHFTGWNNYSLPVGGAALGGVKNGGNVVIGADGKMNAPVSPMDALIVHLVAVTDTEPAVTDLEEGDRYFNTTDHKLYILEDGAWAEDDAPTAGKLYLVEDALYRYSETDYMVLL